MVDANYELITIAFSHYCEKARWVLDRNAVAYRERKYMPTMHFGATLRADLFAKVGRSDRASTRFSTPVLRGRGVHLADSSDIMRHIEPELYALDDAAELDAYYGDHLGPHTRRIVYYFALQNPAVLYELADANVSRRQALVFRAIFPIGKQILMRGLAIDEAAFLRSRDKTRRIADEVEARLRDGRRFLCGDRFSAADLAFAALFAPAILPGPRRVRRRASPDRSRPRGRARDHHRAPRASRGQVRRAHVRRGAPTSRRPTRVGPPARADVTRAPDQTSGRIFRIRPCTMS